MYYVHLSLVALLLFVCLLLVGLILLQRGRGGGLSGAFGGAGGNTAFGSKTGDVLTWATSAVFALFVILAVSLNYSANALNATYVGAASNAGATRTPADLPPVDVAAPIVLPPTTGEAPTTVPTTAESPIAAPSQQAVPATAPATTQP